MKNNLTQPAKLTSQKVKLRKAVRSDKKSILNLVKELAEFEKLTFLDDKAGSRLMKDAFSKDPPFRTLVAEADKKVIGYAFYFFTYSSFFAKKTLYLEDIYISEKYRNLGIGKKYFIELLKIARKNKCGRMEWVVLDWNENAIKFYEKLGAYELKEWKTFRKIINYD
ncbi:MAG TPA: GNAT family N-acetyltransferase [Ignavibacteria bacterium]|nr:GNAT family N-acetyltransferase [Ignavibacteria bacterium]HRA99340.1 GNAT family N-acetyltransferase [Ignavibacteria bacterium]